MYAKQEKICMKVEVLKKKVKTMPAPIQCCLRRVALCAGKQAGFFLKILSIQIL